MTRPTASRRRRGETAKEAEPDQGPALHIGIDAEYTTITVQLPPKRGGGPPRLARANRIISYQWYAVAGSDPVPECTWQGIHYPALPKRPNDPGRSTRLRMGQWIGMAIADGIKKGVIRHWPAHVTVYSHFLRAELGAVKDFSSLKGELASVGGTFTGSDRPARLSTAADGIYRGERVAYRDQSRNLHVFTVRFIDTMLLTPGRGGLAVAGEMIGVEKKRIPAPYSIERMDEFLAGDRVAFEDYAVNDAKVSALTGLYVAGYCCEHVGPGKLPATIGAIGLRLLSRTFSDDRDEARQLRLSAIGREIVSETFYDKDDAREVTKTTEQPVFSRRIREVFAAEAYKGGRNESYWFGPTEVGTWTDYDIKGAYTASMCSLRPLDYAHARQTLDLDDFTIDGVGFAQVRFSFPAGTLYPCLPIATRRGLIYPLTGISVCTAPELVLARTLGAEIEVLEGMVVPWASEWRIFAEFSRIIRELREKTKGTGKERLTKDIGNSQYGKTAQGVRDKKEFSAASGRGERVPPSPITNPFFAAHITGLVRAVLSEILARVPAQYLIVSATTDGLLTNAPEGAIDLSGPLCTHFAELQRTYFDDAKSILKVKHTVAQVVSMRTRGQMTSEERPADYPGNKEILGERILLARAGVKPVLAVPASATADDVKALQNQYMLDLFLDRRGDEKLKLSQLIPLGEMWRTNSDLVNLDRERRVNLEFDMKRRPVRPLELPVAGRVHLAFGTEPWATAEEAAAARIAIDRWRTWEKDGVKGRALKTVADLVDLQQGRETAAAAKTAAMRRTRAGAAGLGRRAFLRAFTHDAWGAIRHGWSYAELAAWLTREGFKTSKDDVNYAKTKEPVPVQLPPDPELFRFIRVVLTRFPTFAVGFVLSREALLEFNEAEAVGDAPRSAVTLSAAE